MGDTPEQLLKEFIERAKAEIGQYKEDRDRWHKEAEKLGEATGDTDAKLEKLNELIAEKETEYHKKLDEYQAAATKEREELEAKVNDLETRLAQPGGQHKPDEKGDREALNRNWWSGLRKSITSMAPWPISYESITDEEKAALMHHKVLRLDDATTGGFLTTPEADMEMIKKIATEYSPIRQLARVDSGSKSSRRYRLRNGTHSAAWAKEYAQLTETTGLTFEETEIVAHKLYSLILITRENLEDSDFDLEQVVMEESAEQFGVGEGTAFVSGNDVDRPEGFLTNSEITNEVASGSASDMTSGDALIDMQYQIKETYTRNLYWVAKRATIGKIRKMKDGAGNYLWTEGFDAAGPTILGNPYREALDMPAVAANAYPLVLANFRDGYRIYDRKSMEMQILVEKYADYDSIGIKGTHRVGGAVLIPEAFSKLKIATSV